jgi:hypothetical protein
MDEDDNNRMTPERAESLNPRNVKLPLCLSSPTHLELGAAYPSNETTAGPWQKPLGRRRPEGFCYAAPRGISVWFTRRLKTEVAEHRPQSPTTIDALS